MKNQQKLFLIGFLLFFTSCKDEIINSKPNIYSTNKAVFIELSDSSFMHKVRNKGVVIRNLGNDRFHLVDSVKIGNYTMNSQNIPTITSWDIPNEKSIISKINSRTTVPSLELFDIVTNFNWNKVLLGAFHNGPPNSHTIFTGDSVKVILLTNDTNFSSTVWVSYHNSINTYDVPFSIKDTITINMHKN